MAMSVFPLQMKGVDQIVIKATDDLVGHVVVFVMSEEQLNAFEQRSKSKQDNENFASEIFELSSSRSQATFNVPYRGVWYVVVDEKWAHLIHVHRKPNWFEF
jgi:hypothetical protein